MKKEMRPGIDYVAIATPFYCNDGEGTFVMHKRGEDCRDERGVWDFGSGQLEFGDYPHQRVLKEVFEEYGCEGEIQEQLPAHSIIRVFDGVTTHWLAIPFFVKVDLSKVTNNEPGKIAEIRFFRLDSLPEPLHSGVAKSIKAYKEYFDRYRK